MAIENPHVTADVVEATEFRPLVERYAIRGVPKTVINNSVEFVGTATEAQFIEYIQLAVTPAGS